MADKNDFNIFRGTVCGKAKYCRILIRRKRATKKEAIAYFHECIQEIDNTISEYTEEEKKELRFAESCFVTAISAISTLDDEQ